MNFVELQKLKDDYLPGKAFGFPVYFWELGRFGAAKR
jgi:hypothetical protein